MEVILLEKIRNFGDIGNQITVKSGFARNFLLPQGKAVTATLENITKFEQRHAELKQKAEVLLAAAKARAEKLVNLVINIQMKVSDEDKLFGSVGIREIATAIEAAGGKIDKKEITLPEGPIHQLGEYEINLQLHSDLIVPIKINIVAE